jgi:hypothetical protein
MSFDDVLTLRSSCRPAIIRELAQAVRPRVLTRTGVTASSTREYVYEAVPVARPRILERLTDAWYELLPDVLTRSMTSEKLDRRDGSAVPEARIDPYITRPSRSIDCGPARLRFTNMNSESPRVAITSPPARKPPSRFRS